MKQSEQIKELEICHIILIEYGIEFNNSEILSSCRKKELVFIRALIMFILRKKGYSLEKTGSILNRDHATVIFSQTYGKSKVHDKRYNKIVKAISKKHIDNEVIHKAKYHLSELTKITVDMTPEYMEMMFKGLDAIKLAITHIESNN